MQTCNEESLQKLTQMLQVAVDWRFCENIVIVVEVRSVLKLFAALRIDCDGHAITTRQFEERKICFTELSIS